MRQEQGRDIAKLRLGLSLRLIPIVTTHPPSSLETWEWDLSVNILPNQTDLQLIFCNMICYNKIFAGPVMIMIMIDLINPALPTKQTWPPPHITYRHAVA